MCRQPESPPPDMLPETHRLPDSIRDVVLEIQSSLRGQRGEDFRGWPGPCVEAACDAYRALESRSRQNVWVALGYATTPHRREPHAWMVEQRDRQWRVIDPSRSEIGDRTGVALSAFGRTGYDAIAYLTPDETRVVHAALPSGSFSPGFFLDIHLRIEQTGLEGLFSLSEVAAMNSMNWQANTNGYDPREHGDNATLREALLLAEDRLAWKDGTTPLVTVVDAPSTIAYGLAFHTLADFYAHSSYVPAAAFYYGGLDAVRTFDEACQDADFFAFLMSDSFSNAMLWQPPRGYRVVPCSLPPEFQHCLISGAYPQGAGSIENDWVGRDDLPIHDDFAIDQPASALVQANPIVPRRHPFAFPYIWEEQFNRREALATAHIRKAATRLKEGHQNPLLGVPVASLPADLFAPEWDVPASGLLSTIRHLVRGKTGMPGVRPISGASRASGRMGTESNGQDPSKRGKLG